MEKKLVTSILDQSRSPVADLRHMSMEKYIFHTFSIGQTREIGASFRQHLNYPTSSSVAQQWRAAQRRTLPELEEVRGRWGDREKTNISVEEETIGNTGS